jgi:hypothetical protein
MYNLFIVVEHMYADIYVLDHKTLQAKNKTKHRRHHNL